MAFSGVGTTFGRGDGTSAETFTDIAEINSISGPNMTRDTIDTTALDTAGGYRTFITSFRDAGEVVLAMNFTVVGYGLMKADFEAAATVNYKITLGNTAASTLDFAALVTNLGTGVPLDDKVSIDVTLKVSGAVTFAS